MWKKYQPPTLLQLMHIMQCNVVYCTWTRHVGTGLGRDLCANTAVPLWQQHMGHGVMYRVPAGTPPKTSIVVFNTSAWVKTRQSDLLNSGRHVYSRHAKPDYLFQVEGRSAGWRSYRWTKVAQDSCYIFRKSYLFLGTLSWHKISFIAVSLLK